MEKVELYRARARGFTLLELVVVIAIVAILGMVLIPNFRGQKEQYDAKNFTAQLNALMQSAWQQALISQKVQRIYFDFNNKKISLTEQAGKDIENFVPVQGPYIVTEMIIPSTYYFRNFYIEGRDEMARGKRKDAWFFLMPSGVAQSVVINIMNQEDGASADETQRFGLVLNPFSAQFDYYDSYQKP